MAGAPEAWRVRSNLMKWFTLLQVLGILLQTFIILSRHWAVADGHGPELSHIGLWDYIVGRHQEALGPSHMVGAVLAVASLVIMIGACMLNMMCLHRRLIAIMASLIALTFTSGVLLVSTLVIWVTTHLSVPHIRLSWATYLAIAIALLHVFISALAAVDLYRTSRKGAPQYRTPQPPANVEGEVDELL